MKIRFLESFKAKLNDQISYIAKDKPGVARRFKSELIVKIKEISAMPLRNRKSIFFNRDDIRDLIYKGYVIIYRIDKENNSIDVFGFTKYEEKPFK